MRQGREKARKELTDEGLTPVGNWHSILLGTLRDTMRNTPKNCPLGGARGAFLVEGHSWDSTS